MEFSIFIHEILNIIPEPMQSKEQVNPSQRIVWITKLIEVFVECSSGDFLQLSRSVSGTPDAIRFRSSVVSNPPHGMECSPPRYLTAEYWWQPMLRGDSHGFRGKRLCFHHWDCSLLILGHTVSALDMYSLYSWAYSVPGVIITKFQGILKSSQDKGK